MNDQTSLLGVATSAKASSFSYNSIIAFATRFFSNLKSSPENESMVYFSMF
jgi:hypothetical protein